MSLILDGTNGLSDVDGSAATPAIRGSDANTGIFFPGADRIGFSEGGVQVGEFDASGNFLMNSGYGSAAVAYACRAWVNFNGTGTVAIRASGNVSSITDNGTGSYTVNITTAMPDANYSAVVTGGADLLDTSGQKFAIMGVSTFLTTSANVTVRQADIDGNTFVAADTDQVCLAIFR